MTSVRWKKEDDDGHYDAAEHFLTLLFTSEQACNYVKWLRAAKVTEHRANDILRAAGLEPLDGRDPLVSRNVARIHAGKRFQPVLLLRARDTLIVVDGYHRICAAMVEAPDEPIRAKLI